MSTTTLALKNFIQLTPICKQLANFEVVLSTFQSGHYDTLVLVSEYNYPIGAISCSYFLSHLIKHNRLKKIDSIGSNFNPTEQQDIVPREELNSLIEPIVSLNAEMSVKEFCSYLQGTKEQKRYALVDSEGKFLGLLNIGSLLKHLLPLTRDCQQNNGKTLFGNIEKTILSLLEQLPFPIRLENTLGQMLYHNLAWRNDIGEFMAGEKSSNASDVTIYTKKHKAISSAPENSLEYKKSSAFQADRLQNQATENTTHLARCSARAKSREEELNIGLEFNSEAATTFCQKQEIRPDRPRKKIRQHRTTGQLETVSLSSKTPDEHLWQFTKFPLKISTDSKIPSDTDLNLRVEPTKLSFSHSIQANSHSSSKARAECNKKDNLEDILGDCKTNSEDLAVRLALESTSASRSDPIPSGDSSSEESPIWLIMGEKITQQEQLCQDLKAKNSELIQLNHWKNELLASISHEIKSPLTAIVGLSTLLQEKRLGKLNQRQARYAEQIYHSGRQLMNLANQLQDLTSLESGQLKLTLEQVNIKETTQRVWETIQQKYPDVIGAEIKFTIEIEPNTQVLLADELRLHQMLVYLVENAIELIEAEGQIHLKVNRWQNWLAFTVWDTGIGIPQESQPKIFQQLQQDKNYLPSDRLQTTGLGLILTQRLAKAHGGDISFISSCGKGTQFTLLLPHNTDFLNAETESRESKTQSDCTFPIVLLVESTSQNIASISEELIDLGYQVVIARSGKEALSKAYKLQPFAILVNVGLPVLSGWEVLHLLKSDDRTKKIPAIAISKEIDRQISKEKSADGFLSLPIDKQALQEIFPQLDLKLSPQTKNLTILCLHPDPQQIGWVGSTIESQLSGFKHRVLEADSLEQGEILARIWKIDVIVLDGTPVCEPLSYLRSLSKCESLASLPLVTWNAKTTEAANQIKGLSVFPCLVPVKKRTLTHLLQAIQIAAKISD